jgi:hypothetical protein
MSKSSHRLELGENLLALLLFKCVCGVGAVAVRVVEEAMVTLEAAAEVVVLEIVSFL